MTTTGKLLRGIVAAGTLSLTMSMHGALTYNDTLSSAWLAGDGTVANTGFTIDRENGIELALRAKVRFPQALNQYNNSSIDATYNMLAGNSAGRPLWSFDWSINSDYLQTSGKKLNDFTYKILIDSDPTAATSFYIFDPIHAGNPVNVLWDHGIGNNSTASGTGDNDVRTVGTYDTLIKNNNVGDNSWRMDFFTGALIPAFDPNVYGLYTIQLQAFDGATLIGDTAITVNVVPEPSTYVAGAMLLLPFGIGALRKLRKARMA